VEDKLEEEKNIKNINRKILVGYLIINFILFCFFSQLSNISFADFNSILEKIANPQHLVTLLLFTLSMILEGVISSNVKAMLVFCRIRNPLPGHRAFSSIAKKDPRINLKDLQKIFPNNTVPKGEEKQNSEWYKLYRKYSSVGTVWEAHRSFLLTRDLAALTLLLIPIALLGHLMLATDDINIIIHLLILFAFLILSIISSRNYGNRFVANVLVEAIQC